jgi:hypothetical protein
MDILESSTARLITFAAGVATHILFFRHGEWDLWTVRLITFFALSHVVGITVLLQLPINDAITPLDATRIVSMLGLSMVSGIWSSVLVYRGLFHRLNRFPGPFFARFSNFYVTGLSAKKLHLYEEVQRLHEQYGDYVRLGMLLHFEFASAITESF